MQSFSKFRAGIIGRRGKPWGGIKMRKNNKASKNIQIKEALKLSMRGYGIWWNEYPKMLVSTAVVSIVSALTPYVGIYLSALIINEISESRDRSTLMRLVLTALISAALLSILNASLGRWKNCQHTGWWYKRSKIYTEKLLSLDFNSIDDPHIHDLRSQISQNEQWGGWGITKLLGSFEAIIKAVMTIMGAIALTASLFILQVPKSGKGLTVLNHPLFIALIAAIMLVVTFISPMLSNKAGSYWAKRSDDARMGNRHFGFYGFMGYDRSRALDIRIYRQDYLCTNMMERDAGFSTKSNIARDARGPMGGLNALSAAVSQVFTGIVYIFVCLKAWGGAFGIGSVTQYISSVTALSGGVASLIKTLGDMQNNAVFLKTTFEFLDMPNDMYQGSLTVEKRSDLKYEIEFKNVSFKYPSSEKYALENISLKFKIGERLAVVGMNGSGKTTFIKLLCRLYDPTEGEILLNGINIKKYDYYDYMSIFSVVFQDFKLFSYSLGQNVAAKMEYKSEKAEECLKEAGFDSRLAELADGLNTYLYKDFDEKGVDISGGEAQKVALARALYKDAPFIVLDEPTAALDPVAEYEVYSRMNEIVGDKTAVFISHRLASCRFCHDIAVFHEGGLIQQGSHDKLVLDKTGKYYELWNAQAQYYTA